jgi:ABC-type transporter Mla subunit MlaD
MKTFEIIVRIFVILLIAGVVFFGVAAVYLNVFEPWKNKKSAAKRWDIHAR